MLTLGSFDPQGQVVGAAIDQVSHLLKIVVKETVKLLAQYFHLLFLQQARSVDIDFEQAWRAQFFHSADLLDFFVLAYIWQKRVLETLLHAYL